MSIPLEHQIWDAEDCAAITSPPCNNLTRRWCGTFSRVEAWRPGEATFMADALAKFAKAAGVQLIEVDPAEWGGRIGYKEADHPNSATCGFRSERGRYSAQSAVRRGQLSLAVFCLKAFVWA